MYTNEQYSSIDESQIEVAITAETTAILATPVFGNSCNPDKIEAIAKKHGLKVIYNAYHCCGVRYKGRSVFTYGDISTCSFLARKLFHTGQGEQFFLKTQNCCSDCTIIIILDTRAGRFPRHRDQRQDERTAWAMGLAVFPYINQLIIEHLQGLQKMKIREGMTLNHSYYKSQLLSGVIRI